MYALILFCYVSDRRQLDVDIFAIVVPRQRLQLLQLGVPATFMLVAFDEGPGPPIRYQYAELGKLYSVVSQLVRCCDVSSRMRSSISVRNSINCRQFFMRLSSNQWNLRRNIV